MVCQETLKRRGRAQERSLGMQMQRYWWSSISADIAHSVVLIFCFISTLFLFLFFLFFFPFFPSSSSFSPLSAHLPQINSQICRNLGYIDKSDACTTSNHVSAITRVWTLASVVCKRSAGKRGEGTRQNHSLMLFMFSFFLFFLNQHEVYQNNWRVW